MTPSYKIEDFALDPLFRAWVNGDPNATVFWTGWLAQFPEQQPVINQARAMVRATKTDMVAVRDADIQREIDRVLPQARIARPPKVIGDEFMPPWASSINWLRLPAAALIFLGLGLGYHMLRQVENVKVAAMANVAPSATRAILERTNQTTKPITLVLPDGSVVTLNPASTIRFANRFTGRFWAVHLSGGAFFEVAHDSQQPFLVYTGKTVIRVLGTRFRVEAAAGNRTVRVAMQTGKVAIYNRFDFDEEVSCQLTVGDEAVLLNPDQQAIFDQTTDRWQVRTVGKRNPTAVPVQKIEVEDIPVSQLLKRLETAYGIVIDCNETLLAGCPITASFSDETLTDKLAIICNAIGAQYEVRNGQIVISRQRCQ